MTSNDLPAHFPEIFPAAMDAQKEHAQLQAADNLQENSNAISSLHAQHNQPAQTAGPAVDIKIRVGVIGFGRMGRSFVSAMLSDTRYDIVSICDIDPTTRELAARTVPTALVCALSDDIFDGPKIDAVGLFTLADARPALIMKALARGVHVLAEKPIAADIKTEWELVDAIEKSGLLVGVNLFNRNAWYHKEMQAFIAQSEIGELAIIRVCHMTPGHMPGEGHEPEGPPFHDCGMHYVDVARWYAGSEYKTWHAQGVRMWGHAEPWWVQCHGTFESGAVFDITQGFVYGHLAAEKTHNCYVDVIGTRGIARMHHDFKDATIECHGVSTTLRKTGPYNDKKLDVMCDLFARSFFAGRDLGLPSARDSAVASQLSWAMLSSAVANDPPAIGTQHELAQILDHRRSLASGFGLPVRTQEYPAQPCPTQPASQVTAAARDAPAAAVHAPPTSTNMASASLPPSMVLTTTASAADLSPDEPLAAVESNIGISRVTHTYASCQEHNLCQAHHRDAAHSPQSGGHERCDEAQPDTQGLGGVREKARHQGGPRVRLRDGAHSRPAAVRVRHRPARRL